MTSHQPLKPRAPFALPVLSSASVVVLVGSLGVHSPAAQAALTRQACDLQGTADAIDTRTDVAIDIDVLDNDNAQVDPNTVELSIDENRYPHSTSNDPISAMGGRLALASSSQVRYTPPPHFRGVDTFYYRAVEKDWRGNGTHTFNRAQVTLVQSDPPSRSSVGDGILAATDFGVWPGEAGSSQDRFIGRVVTPVIDSAQLCRTDTENGNATGEVVSLNIRWEYAKISGANDPASQPIQVVITPEPSDLGANQASSVADVTADINQITQTLTAEINDVTAAEFDNYQIGFYALNFGQNGKHEWVTNTPIITGSIDVSGCELCSTEVAVNVTVGATEDSDGDGVNDAIDIDKDNDGILDALEGFSDTDGDGLPADRDLDADNDNVVDRVELGLIDADGDGKIDGEFIDENGDGMHDPAFASWFSVADPVWGLTAESSVNPLENRLPDTDGDGLANINDIDSDNDLITDIIENQGIDINADGHVDNFIDDNDDGLSDRAVGKTLSLVDSDFDLTPNAYDTNSDNDTIELNSNSEVDRYDIAEVGKPRGVGLNDPDVNNNGRTDRLEDTDQNGVPDLVDINITAGEDSDNDFIDDRYDASVQGEPDADNDGISDDYDPDRNGDGMDDRYLRTTDGQAVAILDTDQDGQLDPYDSQNEIFNDPNASVNTGVSGGAGGFGGVLMGLLGAAFAWHRARQGRNDKRIMR